MAKTIKTKSYNIHIDKLKTIQLKGKVAIITDETVAKYHLDKLKKKINANEIYTIILKPGEKQKNIKIVQKILKKLFLYKFNRHSTLIAFGGGVVGDIVGFCASIYERGINFIQIPTTLLAQVDASVGGKTGINNKFGKNLIGTFYQPKAVFIDISFLKTLPKRIFKSGIAEIIKIATIYDRDFFKFLEQKKLSFCHEKHLKEAITRSIELKAKIVSFDEKEKGLRAILNYGHTFAHVIENKTNYDMFYHGEAVAFGMLMANKLAYDLGYLSKKECKKIEKLIEKNDLLKSFKNKHFKVKNPHTFYEKFFLDKKSLDKNILFVLPCGIGSFKLKNNIKKKIVLQAIKRFS